MRPSSLMTSFFFDDRCTHLVHDLIHPRDTCTHLVHDLIHPRDGCAYLAHDPSFICETDAPISLMTSFLFETGAPTSLMTASICETGARILGTESRTTLAQPAGPVTLPFTVQCDGPEAHLRVEWQRAVLAAPGR